MGWDDILVPRCGAIVDAFAAGFPVSMEVPRDTRLVWGSSGGHETSDNHEACAWSAEYARAAVWGTDAEYEAARAVLLWWIDQELTVVGLWRHEQTSGMPHGGMHLDALVTYRPGALFKKDTEVVAASDRHLRATACVLAAGATPGGGVWLPGERDPGGPISPQATAFWREWRGVPHRGALAPVSARIGRPDWSGKSWVQVRGIRALKARAFNGYDSVARTSTLPLSYLQSNPLPLLRRPMTVRRWSGGHLARIDRPGPFDQRGVAGVCDWVLVDHAVADGAKVFKSAGVTYGLEWSKEPPAQLHNGGLLESLLESPRRAA